MPDNRCFIGLKSSNENKGFLYSRLNDYENFREDRTGYVVEERIRPTTLFVKSTAASTENLEYGLNDRLREAFRYIAKLANDWDSYGAIAPTDETIELAKKVCMLYPRELQPEVQPEKDGSVGLYWDLDETFLLKINRRGSLAAISDIDGVPLVEKKRVSAKNIFEIAKAYLVFFRKVK